MTLGPNGRTASGERREPVLGSRNLPTATSSMNRIEHPGRRSGDHQRSDQPGGWPTAPARPATPPTRPRTAAAAGHARRTSPSGQREGIQGRCRRHQPSTAGTGESVWRASSSGTAIMKTHQPGWTVRRRFIRPVAAAERAHAGGSHPVVSSGLEVIAGSSDFDLG